MITRSSVKLTGDRNQCPGCGVLFNSTFAFDKHRIGEFGLPAGHPKGRRCMTAEEMLEAGMRRNAQGFWVGNPVKAGGTHPMEHHDE